MLQFSRGIGICPHWQSRAVWVPRVFRFANEGKDGLTVKSFLAMLLVVAVVAVISVGSTGCGKKDATPTGAAAATPKSTAP